MLSISLLKKLNFWKKDFFLSASYSSCFLAEDKFGYDLLSNHSTDLRNDIGKHTGYIEVFMQENAGAILKPLLISNE